jgi:hypothetical protein
MMQWLKIIFTQGYLRKFIKINNFLTVPGAKSPPGQKGVCTLDVHGSAGDRTVTLQCPSKAAVPSGPGVGGVSGRAGVRAGGSNPSAMTPSRVVMVEGIPVFGKAALFAGRRRNEDLGRSVTP